MGLHGTTLSLSLARQLFSFSFIIIIFISLNYFEPGTHVQLGRGPWAVGRTSKIRERPNRTKKEEKKKEKKRKLVKVTIKHCEREEK